jgi:hypothetical protein
MKHSEPSSTIEEQQLAAVHGGSLWNFNGLFRPTGGPVWPRRDSPPSGWGKVPEVIIQVAATIDAK